MLVAGSTLPIAAPAIDQPIRWRWRYVAFTAVCSAVAVAAGLTTSPGEGALAEVWAVAVVNFIWLSLVWEGKRPRISPALVGSLVGMATIFATVGLVFGLSPDEVPRLVLGNLVQAVVLCGLYRAWLSGRSWAPETPRELIGLLVASLVSATVVLPIGAAPGLWWGQVDDRVLLWWVLRNAVYCFLGGACVLILWHRRRQDEVISGSIAQTCVLVVVTAACLWWVFLDPHLPLTWLLLVPCVWAGMLLSPYGAALHVLGLGLGAAVMATLPQNQFGYEGFLPPAVIMDVLIVVCTFIALLLALFRDQRARLVAQLSRQREKSAEQARLLEVVFDSMSDGVIITDGDGMLSRHNKAARILLGRPIPAARPESWAAYFDLRAVDGTPLQDSDLPFRAPFGDGTATELLVPGHGENDPSRMLSLTARTISTEGVPRATLLFRDITAEQTRIRELQDFAGRAAHDLRGPLTVLNGWLELVTDARAHGDESEIEPALDRARVASMRMRQVIDDWLAYSVARDGVIQPARLPLRPVWEELVRMHAGSLNGTAARATFEVDTPHDVHADPVLLRQLADNLLGNAVKYTRPGQPPWVRVRSERDAEPGWVRITVADHGIGIPPGEEERIFEEFHRSAESAGRYAGSGLGLALCRRIVARHGGRISACRNSEGGSTFSFTMPAA